MAFGIAQIDPVLYFLFGLCLALLVYPVKPCQPTQSAPSDKFRVMRSVGAAIMVGLVVFGLRMFAGELYGRDASGVSSVVGASMIPSSA